MNKSSDFSPVLVKSAEGKPPPSDKKKPTQPKQKAPKSAASASEEAAPKPTPEQTAKPSPPTAIVIDDEPANRDFLVRLIAQGGYQSIGAASGKEGIEQCQAVGNPTVIFIDSELPDMNGLDLIKQFRGDYPQAKLIMATMHDNRTLIHSAFEYGCDAFLVKPHGFMELFKRLQQLSQDSSVIDRIIIDKYGIRDYHI